MNHHTHPHTHSPPPPRAFYALQAVSSFALFLWLFPTIITPLFPEGLTVAGQWLTRASALGMVLVGARAGGVCRVIGSFIC